MIKKKIVAVTLGTALIVLLTGCLPSNPAQPYERAVDDAKQVQKQLDKHAEDINNYDPTKP